MESNDSENNRRENKDRIATTRISKEREKDGKGSFRQSAHSNLNRTEKEWPFQKNTT